MAPDSQHISDANRYRIQRLEQDVHDLTVKLEDYGAVKQTVANLEATVKTLSDEFAGLRRALAVASLSIAGSAVLFAVTVLVARFQ